MESDQHIELRMRYENYLDDFGKCASKSLQQTGRIDLSGLDYWQFPLLLILGDPQIPVKMIPDLAAFETFMSPAYKPLSERGWLGIGRITSFEVSAASETTALLSVSGDRLDGDGQVMNGWDLFYLHARRDGKWVQTCVMNKNPRCLAGEDLFRWAQALQTIA